MVTLTELKPSLKELEFLHKALISTDCGNAGVFTGISATEEQIKKYVDALFLCSLRLIKQKPKILVLPLRGGAVLGWDVHLIASCIASTEDEYFHTYPIELETTGIYRDKSVDKRIEEELKKLDKMSESCNIDDEQRSRLRILPRLNDLTIIDTVYTGSGYSRLLQIFSKVLPDAKVNGIVMQDDMYEIDISFFRQKHKDLNGGDFFYVRAPLIFEDQPTTIHKIKGIDISHYLRIPTKGYSVVRSKVLKHVFQKEPLINNPAYRTITNYEM